MIIINREKELIKKQKDELSPSYINLKNPRYIEYHDKEWCIPNHDDNYLFEMLILESFQAGLWWECVLNKREDFREAFDNFNIEKICTYDDKKVEKLLKNEKKIRNDINLFEKSILKKKEKIEENVKEISFLMDGKNYTKLLDSLSPLLNSENYRDVKINLSVSMPRMQKLSDEEKELKEEKINKNTKAVILNSPSNPTGAVMDKEDIKAIADLSTDHDFLIISDEIYEKIIYDKKHYSPAAYSDNVITINGFSKTYAMTGLRIGYLNAKEEYLEELLKIHQYNIACANSTAQRGAYEALTGPQDTVNKMVNEFKKRRDLIVSRLNEMGYETVNAQGAFYVFPKIENTEEFVKKSAEEGVITVPGAAFGQNGKNHVRMSYANSYENIAKAMDILEKGE